MNRAIAAVGLLTTALLLAACTSTGGSRPSDTATATAPATITASTVAKATPKLSAATPAHTAATKAAAPGPASCKAAIKAQYGPGTAQLTGAPSKPPACEGLSSDELSQVVTDVITENTGG